MEIALELAEEAHKSGEVPVGAVIVNNGEVIGRGRNRIEETESHLAHAEILAIKNAEHKHPELLTKSTIYITLEPCPMCAGAILLCKIPGIIYGASEPKMGALGSAIDLTGLGRFTHQPFVKSGILEERCQSLLKSFFKELRSS